MRNGSSPNVFHTLWGVKHQQVVNVMFHSLVEVILGYPALKNYQRFGCSLGVPFSYVQNEALLCVAVTSVQHPQGSHRTRDAVSLARKRIFFLNVPKSKEWLQHRQSTDHNPGVIFAILILSWHHPRETIPWFSGKSIIKAGSTLLKMNKWMGNESSPTFLHHLKCYFVPPPFAGWMPLCSDCDLKIALPRFSSDSRIKLYL